MSQPSQEILSEIKKAVSRHAESEHVAYEDEMQSLNVVGESFHSGDLTRILRADREANLQLPEEEGSDWYSGYLQPEPSNPYDSNAVKVVLIEPTSEGLRSVDVGYLGRDQAKRVQKKIIKIMNRGSYIPLLLKLHGGTSSFPNVGVMAKAMTTEVKF